MKFETTSSFSVNFRLPQAIPYHRVARHARALASRQNDDHREILNSTSWEPPLIWVEMSSQDEVGAMSLGFFDMTGDAESQSVSTPTTPMSDVSSGDVCISSDAVASSRTTAIVLSSVFSAESTDEASSFSTLIVATPSKPSPSTSFSASLVADSPASSSSSSLASTPSTSPSSSPLQSHRTLTRFSSEVLQRPIRSRSSASLKRSREVMEAIHVASNPSSTSSLASSSSW